MKIIVIVEHEIARIVALYSGLGFVELFDKVTDYVKQAYGEEISEGTFNTSLQLAAQKGRISKNVVGGRPRYYPTIKKRRIRDPFEAIRFLDSYANNLTNSPDYTSSQKLSSLVEYFSEWKKIMETEMRFAKSERKKDYLPVIAKIESILNSLSIGLQSLSHPFDHINNIRRNMSSEFYGLGYACP